MQRPRKRLAAADAEREVVWLKETFRATKKSGCLPRSSPVRGRGQILTGRHPPLHLVARGLSAFRAPNGSTRGGAFLCIACRGTRLNSFRSNRSGKRRANLLRIIGSTRPLKNATRLCGEPSNAPVVPAPHLCSRCPLSMIHNRCDIA
ncbi:MAG: hypothetical protein HY749_17975 [Gammaproteobacteria bacterium]|nr:hypothetical protein [Gammaproteobacteria bacterium]